MSAKRLKTWQKATALVPLALLSGAWTASLSVTGTASAAAEDGARLPDGTSIPDQAISAPASVSVPGEIAPGVPDGAARSVISSASTNGIPAAALAAYQRAAQVIDAADPTCHLDWPLIAAIGRVESDHGRYGGNTLTEDGRSTPGIYGIALDGSDGTARIGDTDAGQYDNDPVHDRAVGPMQFIPSTWSVVGVDGDGDGKRDPQDIDDAALATAVYLCSGKEDLSTAAGQRTAVYRYNHSQDYVDLVLSIMRAYADGDFSAVPSSAAAPTVFAPAAGGSATPRAGAGHAKASGKKARAGGAAGASGTGGTAPGPTGGSKGGTGSTGGGTTTPAAPGTGGGSGPAPSAPATDVVTQAPEVIKQTTQPVVDTLAAGAEALSFCTTELSGVTSNPTVLDKCAAKVAGMTEEQAAAAIPNTLAGVLAWLGLTLGGLLGP